MSDQFDIFKNQFKEIFCSIKQIQSENKLIKDQNIKLSEEVLQLNKKLIHWNKGPFLSLLVSQNPLMNRVLISLIKLHQS